MCGPLVTAYSDRIATNSQSNRRETVTPFIVQQHALFNLGRAASYALIGVIFGTLGFLAFGSVETVAAAGDGVRAVIGILVGIAIIIGGLYYLRGRPGLPHGLPIVGTAATTVAGLISSRIDRLATSPGIIGLGAIHGLLPCPIIYPAYLYAFVLGDPLRGGLALGILGLGTIPTLFAYGTLLGTIDTSTRITLHRAMGVTFIILGYVPLQHGLMLLGVDLPHPPLPFYDPL